MSSKREVVLDMHCYFDNRMKYIVKELSMYDFNYHSTQHWIFKPPKGLCIYVPKARKANNWVRRHLHRIPWDEGDVEYDQLAKILHRITSDFNVIYVKGGQKIDFIRQQVPDNLSIVNVESMGCPKMNTLLEPLSIGAHCIFHNSEPTMCAVHKSRAIAHWMLTDC